MKLMLRIKCKGLLVGEGMEMFPGKVMAGFRAVELSVVIVATLNPYRLWLVLHGKWEATVPPLLRMNAMEMHTKPMLV